jgi:hypothetical protein
VEICINQFFWKVVKSSLLQLQEELGLILVLVLTMMTLLTM